MNMNVPHNKASRVWTVSQAKTHLSEILRLAEEEGPQHIGKRRPFVVVPARQWHERNQSRQSMGRWLVNNIPRGVDLSFKFDRKSIRDIPFRDGEIE